MRDYAREYAEQVLKEKKENKYVQLACKRFLNDLHECENNPDSKWIWDLEEALKIVKFGESLSFVKGGQLEPVKLKPFQKFILMNLNGFRHREEGYRRYKNSFVSVSRKNGKSILMAIITLFYSNFYPNYYSQIYLVGVKLQSAKIVFNEIKKFIEIDNDLEEMFDIKDYKSEIYCKNTRSTIKALGKSTDIDGFQPFLGIVDEYHLHKDNQLMKLLSDGMKSLNDSLLSVITTAGFQINGNACFEEYCYCKNLLEGIAKNDRYFTMIFEVDDSLDIFSKEAIYQCNPLLRDFPTQVEDIINEGNRAKNMGGSELNNFLVKTMNRYTHGLDTKYIDIKHIEKCFSNKTLEDFRGKKVHIGLDLSQSSDLTSIAIVIKDKDKIFVHQHSFMPKEIFLRMQENGTKVPFNLWFEKGLLSFTEGLRTDYKQVLRYLKNTVDEYKFKISEISYDPYNMNIFIQDIEETFPNVNLIKIVQSCKSLSSATEDFRLQIMEGKVEFNKDDELLVWSLGNAHVVKNSFDEIKIDKKNVKDKIDAVDAIIDAWKSMFNNDKNMDIDVKKSLNDYFNRMNF